jgi:hypothetical protein
MKTYAEVAVQPHAILKIGTWLTVRRWVANFTLELLNFPIFTTYAKVDAYGAKRNTRRASKLGCPARSLVMK